MEVEITSIDEAIETVGELCDEAHRALDELRFASKDEHQVALLKASGALRGAWGSIEIADQMEALASNMEEARA